MGNWFQVFVDLDATADEAPRLARRVVGALAAEGVVLAERTGCVLGLPSGHPPGPGWQRYATDDWDWAPTDGLAVHTGRTCFHSGPDMPGAAVCPRCAAATPLEDTAWPRFSDAIGTWHDTGAAAVDCPACGAAVAIPDWTWDEAPLAFGHLGFEFWNWPDFTPEFHALLSRLLDGHRTVCLWGGI
ncbi:hypothetical protein [Streptomyces sp. NPDC052610]|uniref:hypothetical protein n=1 Tax=Streptomyces sp. NPDC052610 TaxID=3154952 RepID=UPI0034275A0D